MTENEKIMPHFRPQNVCSGPPRRPKSIRLDISRYLSELFWNVQLKGSEKCVDLNLIHRLAIVPSASFNSSSWGHVCSPSIGSGITMDCKFSRFESSANIKTLLASSNSSKFWKNLRLKKLLKILRLNKFYSSAEIQRMRIFNQVYLAHLKVPDPWNMDQTVNG